MLKEIIFPMAKKMKKKLAYTVYQQRLVIMDTFADQVNDTLHDLLKGNNFTSVIIPHNVTDEFQHFNVYVNKP